MDPFLRKLRAAQDQARAEEAQEKTVAPEVARTRDDRLRLIRASAEKHSDMFAEVVERKRLRSEEALDGGPDQAGDDGPRVNPVNRFLRGTEHGQDEFGER